MSQKQGYGLTIVDGMDCSDFTLFNRLALDMGVHMEECWYPDEDFLKRRNKIQLQKIIAEAGFSGQFASVPLAQTTRNTSKVG